MRTEDVLTDLNTLPQRPLLREKREIYESVCLLSSKFLVIIYPSPQTWACGKLSSMGFLRAQVKG